MAEEPARFALVIGANRGYSDEIDLRYAVRDAKRVADTLTRLGGFPASQVITLVDSSAPRIFETLDKLSQRISQHPAAPSAILMVFYSGHADAESMHVGGTALPWSTVRERVRAAPAGVRLLVIDACRSGKITRVKGTRLLKAGAQLPRMADAASGFAVLSSAAADEDAQESDALQASFFTHHFLSALSGIADSNADGLITLAEAFHYTSERTISSTSTSEAGAQHPTYLYELKGRSEVVLTQPGRLKSLAQLGLLEAGQYFFHRDSGGKPLLAEANVTQGPLQIWLPQGNYWVRVRTAAGVVEGPYSFNANRSYAIKLAELQARKPYVEFAQKGRAKNYPWRLSVWGGYASPFIAHFPGSPLLLLALGYSTQDWVLEGTGFGTALSYDQPDITTSLLELGVGFGLRRVLLKRPFALALGLRLGVIYASQSYESELPAPSRNTFVPWIGPNLLAELPLAERWVLELGGGLNGLVLSFIDDGSVGTLRFRGQAQVYAGVGYQW